MNLSEYGYIEPESRDYGDLIPGRITQLHRERYKIICKHGEIPAVLLGTFYHDAATREEFPAVGDFVLLRYNEHGESGIAKVLPRKSKFSRTDFSGRGSYAKTVYEQVVATNFDYVFIVVSLNRNFNLNRISRYLTASWQSGGIPVIVLSKADLAENYQEAVELVQETTPHVPVIAVSTMTGIGLAELKEYLQPGQTIVFLGSSGVGKSSLLNFFAEEKVMDVGEIRESDCRGRHTTTHRQMFRLPCGALVIDTPGLRELGLWNASESVGGRFTEIEELFPLCKFNDCSHDGEPGCAVQAAIADGSLSELQWEDYLTQKQEAEFIESKAVYLRKKESRFREIKKYLRKNEKKDRW